MSKSKSQITGGASDAQLVDAIGILGRREASWRPHLKTPVGHLYGWLTGDCGRKTYAAKKMDRKYINASSVKGAIKALQASNIRQACRNAIMQSKDDDRLNDWFCTHGFVSAPPVVQVEPAPEPKADLEAILVPVDKAEIARMILAKYNII